jgi:4-hydroxy-3-methylbut-2-enyl diphosphate reductase
MVDRASEVQPEWGAGKSRVGVTAGASAPEVLVREVVAALQAAGAGSVEEWRGIEENVVFPLPKELARSE